jgi:CubicO group peptidase (beta-lactamase class C family)
MLNIGLASNRATGASASRSTEELAARHWVAHRHAWRLHRYAIQFVVIMAVALQLQIDTGRAYGFDPPSQETTATNGSAPVPGKLRPGDPHAHGITDQQLDTLTAVLRKAVDDGTVPGVSLLLAHKGEVIFKEAFGNLALDQKVQMASSSKPVTATLIMILVDRGKLALEDPIEKYLPEFKGISLNGKQPAKLPTVRQLLCNMSGLPGDFLWSLVRNRLSADNVKAQNDATKETHQELGKQQAKEQRGSRIELFSRPNQLLAESVRAVAKRGLATEPGAEFHYCTIGFNVAARVAEVAAGHPFEELIRTELLHPLGMEDTSYIPMGTGGLSSKPALKSPESRFITAGGGLASTLDDFAAFYLMHANGGTYNGRRILSDQAVSQMHTKQGKLELLMSGPYGNDYGLAFFLDRLDGKGHARMITHPGLFGTCPWLDKDRDLVGVFLVQSSFLRVTPLVREIQATVREIIPVIKAL